jgi:hypothetical protein
MTKQPNGFMHNSKMKTRRVLPGSLAAVALVSAAGTALLGNSQTSHSEHKNDPPAKLVEIVRNSTRKFTDINAAIAAGYRQNGGCVSGPDRGAMGVHFAHPVLFADPQLDATRPEVLVYESVGGRLRLVAVEYVVDAATWLRLNNNVPPVLEGQHFHFVNSPNRYNSPPFFELHVWAWRDNPSGTFADWNPEVSCDKR